MAHGLLGVHDSDTEGWSEPDSDTEGWSEPDSKTEKEHSIARPGHEKEEHSGSVCVGEMEMEIFLHLWLDHNKSERTTCISLPFSFFDDKRNEKMYCFEHSDLKGILFAITEQQVVEYVKNGKQIEGVWMRAVSGQDTKWCAYGKPLKDEWDDFQRIMLGDIVSSDTQLAGFQKVEIGIKN